MRAIEGRWSRWVVVALALGFLRACSLETEAPAGPCTDDEAVCDDDNPCTNDICASDGFCDHGPSSLLPDDGNACTKDLCADLKEQHTNLDDGAPCGLNGALQCVKGKCACSAKAECGQDTACITFACEDSSCASTYAAKDTVVDDAEEDDCKKNACDGNGNIEKVADAADVPPDPTAGDCKTYACSGAGDVAEVDAPADSPADDANPCTIEACNGGEPINHEPAADGTACGPAGTCGPAVSGFEQISQPACFGGACMPASASSCGLYACNGDTCGDACQANPDCASFAYCDPAGKCVGQGDFGQPCASDGECMSNVCADGVCCSTSCGGTCRRCDVPGLLGVCNNVPSGQDPDNECGGTAVCDGAAGCGKLQGDACGSDGDCISAQCEDGVCCNVDCMSPCKRCDLAGSAGVCGDVPSGQTPAGCNTNGQQCNGAGSCKKATGSACNSASECLSGFCPSENGNGPRVCCDKACSGTCESCVGAKTLGTDGVCKFVTNKSDPDNECSGQCEVNGDGCCNGAGVCNPHP